MKEHTRNVAVGLTVLIRGGRRARPSRYSAPCLRANSAIEKRRGSNTSCAVTGHSNQPIAIATPAARHARALAAGGANATQAPSASSTGSSSGVQ